MKYTATIEKTKAAMPAGEYVRTSIDNEKDAADIRIVACDGSYTLRVNRPEIVLKGRGIRAYSVPGSYEVTERALEALEKKYKIVTDF